MMIGGVGVDAVSIDRVSRLGEGFINRFYHPNEANKAMGLEASKRQEFLASRFAVKEALCKALGVGLGAFKFKDVEVISLESGKPEICLHNSAKDYVMTKYPSFVVHLSITHEKPLAIAFVVIEVEDEQA